jgi:1,4-dihydroxy-2-naphthoyl-CoA hydrolase
MTTVRSFPADIADINRLGDGLLPGLIGLEFTSVEPGRVAARLNLTRHHLAPNGYLHAATVIALADTACGYGCMATLPEDAAGFTTIELKTNFLGTKTEGTIGCVATIAHGGRTTQLWDAVVSDESTGRRLALFRCTQLVIRQ